LDIKDLSVNIPIDETIAIVKTQLTENKIDKDTITQAGTLLETILRQNDVQSGDKFFQPQKGVDMGSPVSGLIAEIFLQYYKQLLVKNILDDNKILFYNRYVDDILIIYDTLYTNDSEIHKYLNNIHPSLQFKTTKENNNTISFLDLLITRNEKNLSINIFRKPTATDTKIRYKSNHSMQHKTAAYRHMLNRLYALPLSQEHKDQELHTIFHIAKENGYPHLYNR
jgi:hypothetical protein